MIGTDVAGTVRELKQQPGGNILQYGFGSVTRLLLEHGLLDELRLWLHPVLSGEATAGELLYRDGAQRAFMHAGTEVHSTGLMILTYVPAPGGVGRRKGKCNCSATRGGWS